MLSEILNKVLEDIPEENKQYVKDKITDYVDEESYQLAKQRHVEITEDIIEEVLKGMGSIQDFIDKNLKEPEEYKWALNKIVDTDMCAKCGTCVVVCPNNLLEFTDRPQLTQECRRDGNGMCMEVCPRMNSAKYAVEIREDFKEEYYYGKGTIEGQDGGVVSSFLKYLMESEKIDGAIVVGDEQWKPVSMIVKSPDELKKTVKSKYTISTFEALKEAYDQGLRKVAVVGLPCQIQGLRKIQYFPYHSKHSAERGWDGKAKKLPEIEYMIGLFCTEKFNKETIDAILEEHDINIGDVQKFNVTNGKFIIETVDNTLKLPVKDIKVAPGCKMCRDFDSQLADVSVGSVGSEEGYSTIIIRTEKGEDIKNIIPVKEGVDLSKVQFLRNFKEKKFQKALKKRVENDEFISYYWNDYYGGVGLRTDGKHFIRLRANPSGFYSHEEVQAIMDITKKYGAEIKITNREEFELHGFEPIDVENAIKDLRESGFINGSEGPLVRSALACPGNQNCKLGLINTTAIAQECENRFKELPAPYKFKIAVSGCPNKCIRPQVADFGINGYKVPYTVEDKCNGCGRCSDVCKVDAIDITGDISHTDYDVCIGCGKCVKACPHEARDLKYDGFNLHIGGMSGRKIVEGLTLNVEDEETIYKLIEATIKVYNKYGRKPQKERVAATMKRIGELKFMDEVKKEMESAN
ncbi:Coenzyme F420 hydrogenase/dehydrogenase, beta subunit C-terminal domain [Methanosphaera sp.]|jgi:coenzyme F420-reducing hydrogenase beta subunit/dissimilatory sulfite reductase (desulfoviridin) alpha/beta subunit|uniref:Coenzyme F420 hydrogenase/dehydrogenase, beta subunit C-terminal domain n=1 Tax=Methanosphaera sp. TaxID=2666342 RepID=UPI002A50C217|nr:Coenzyme F420 hydrogenase/dehydrogenase, beta subunit C-terminal domain [Methanobacteriaceae archaeon]